MASEFYIKVIKPKMDTEKRARRMMKVSARLGALKHTNLYYTDKSVSGLFINECNFL